MTESLFKAGAFLEIYDPMVSKESILSDIKFYWKSVGAEDVTSRILVKDSLKDLKINNDALAILTDWTVFKTIDFSNTIVFDGRGITNAFNYSIGRKLIVK